jgi:hypothetical protein
MRIFGFRKTGERIRREPLVNTGQYFRIAISTIALAIGVSAGEAADNADIRAELRALKPSKAQVHENLNSARVFSLPGPTIREKSALKAAYPSIAGKLQLRLLEAVDLAKQAGETAALEYLAGKTPDAGEADIEVIVQCAPKRASEIATWLKSNGGGLLRIGRGHVKAAVPVPRLEQLAELPAASRVRLPIKARHKNTVKTEGLEATAADTWHSAGFTGTGVKLAVVDAGFIGLASLKSQDEIPSSAIEVDFTGSGMESGTSHGCSCAQIVYDLAPGAEMYLLKVSDASDMEAAADYCIENGISVVSYSLGFDCINFHDGTAPSSVAAHPVETVNRAGSNGTNDILWVTAAGNEQVQHAMIEWRDQDSNGFLDWNTSDYSLNQIWNNGNPVPAGTQISGYLTWNRWPTTDQDFDFLLMKNTGSGWEQADYSNGYQDGAQAPYEIIDYTVTEPGDYAFVVKKYSASSSPRFILRTYPYEIFYYGYDNYNSPSPGSISIPGDAASAFTAGAVDQSDYATGPLETYSSLGPGNGAYTGNPVVTKPDICGPDGVLTESGERFWGTSAATPHIAGLSALVKERFPAYDNHQIKAFIENHGLDLGTTGKDNSYGSGTCIMATTNDPPADISLSNSSIAENQPENTAVGSLAATDPDPGNTHTFTFANGPGSDDNDSFSLEGNTLLAATAFDHEASAARYVRIRANDQGGLASEKPFTVTVTDIDDTFVVTFAPAGKGDITGAATQEVNAGGNCTAVTAAPDAYYHFQGWTGDYSGTHNPLTVTDVSTDMSIAAKFAANILTNDTPQWWLAAHSLGTNDSDAVEDDDSDGVENWAEYAADTDPADPESNLRITGIDLDREGVRVSWQGGTGALQYLQAKHGPPGSPGQWVTVFSNIPPTPPDASKIEAPSNTTMFYRIKAERP